MPLSKTEFARRLRDLPSAQSTGDRPEVDGKSQRRGRSRGRVSYFGENVFSDLWSGDTRTMIQLITDVVDDVSEATQHGTKAKQIVLPVKPDVQDRVFRNRGGLWLNSHTRNEPTDPKRMKEELVRLQELWPAYKLCGGYGDHLKGCGRSVCCFSKGTSIWTHLHHSRGRNKERSASDGIPRRDHRRVSD